MGASQIHALWIWMVESLISFLSKFQPPKKKAVAPLPNSAEAAGEDKIWLMKQRYFYKGSPLPASYVQEHQNITKLSPMYSALKKQQAAVVQMGFRICSDVAASPGIDPTVLPMVDDFKSKITKIQNDEVFNTAVTFCKNLIGRHQSLEFSRLNLDRIERKHAKYLKFAVNPNLKANSKEARRGRYIKGEQDTFNDAVSKTEAHIKEIIKKTPGPDYFKQISLEGDKVLSHFKQYSRNAKAVRKLHNKLQKKWNDATGYTNETE